MMPLVLCWFEFISMFLILVGGLDSWMNLMNSIESDDAFGTILVRVNFPVDAETV